jgi:predicted DNA-binding transcriptional regulator AlpA
MQNIDELKEMAANDLLLGAGEIAKFVGISKAMVYHAARQKTLPIGKWGWKLMASKHAITRWIAKNST